jgi:hypothetical protein
MAEFSEFTAANAMAVFPSTETAPRITGKAAAGRASGTKSTPMNVTSVQSAFFLVKTSPIDSREG